MTKKKANKDEIDSVKSSLYYKIFDILLIKGKKYYLDKEFNLIWDDQKDLVGIINKEKYYFFEDFDILINLIKNEYSYN